MSSVHKDQEMGPGKQARLGSQFLPLLSVNLGCRVGIEGLETAEKMVH